MNSQILIEKESNNQLEDLSKVEQILALDEEMEKHFQDVLNINKELDRTIVSFQANKKTPFHRWYKYKEAFSSSLVEYFISKYKITKNVLDPFSGIGTTLFSSSSLGINSDGIELLPIGQFIINAREVISSLQKEDFIEIEEYINAKAWLNTTSENSLNELRITAGAYPEETKLSIEKFLTSIKNKKEAHQVFYKFILLSVLESISYTRKDGQYLRWDHRSGRRADKTTFDKGIIKKFDEAICEKASEVIEDCLSFGQIVLFNELKNNTSSKSGKIHLIKGSCLDNLPQLEGEKYSIVITSPPYCNRYDYTRTYALELALLGCSETDVVALRQQMLTCTVENRDKDLIAFSENWQEPIKICKDTPLLQEIISYLEDLKLAGKINNNGIPRMVKGYFYEMACVVYELYRVLETGGRVIMVNDNVRYAGVPISVDLILSKIAECIGFTIEEIMVLPNGKGNSSQQMGLHGRTSLRKCVYVWRK